MPIILKQMPSPQTLEVTLKFPTEAVYKQYLRWCSREEGVIITNILPETTIYSGENSPRASRVSQPQTSICSHVKRHCEQPSLTEDVEMHSRDSTTLQGQLKESPNKESCANLLNQPVVSVRESSASVQLFKVHAPVQDSYERDASILFAGEAHYNESAAAQREQEETQRLQNKVDLVKKLTRMANQDLPQSQDSHISCPARSTEESTMPESSQRKSTQSTASPVTVEPQRKRDEKEAQKSGSMLEMLYHLQQENLNKSKLQPKNSPVMNTSEDKAPKRVQTPTKELVDAPATPALNELRASLKMTSAKGKELVRKLNKEQSDFRYELVDSKVKCAVQNCCFELCFVAGDGFLVPRSQRNWVAKHNHIPSRCTVYDANSETSELNLNITLQI